MMFKFAAILVVIFSLNAYGQSRRVVPGGDPAKSSVAAGSTAVEQSVKQMFDEANAYAKNKFADFELKKVAYSEALRKQTQREQKQLAAKYASLVSQRTNLSGDDNYYLGMLHWIAENFDGTNAALGQYLRNENAAPEKLQTARSVLVVISAKRRNFDEAETRLSEYLKTGPVKMSERARMENELGKAYLLVKNYDKAASHAAEAFAATRSVLSDPGLRNRSLDQLVDDAVVLFDAYRDDGKVAEADASLEELRKAAATLGSPEVYYYAVDNQIKYMIETGRKPKALELYAGAFVMAAKDFPVKTQENAVTQQLKKREKHYKLLGEPAPELGEVDRWFPGRKTTLEGLRGKVVLLDFWATWCAPCFDAFPHLSEWNEEYKADGLYILGLTRYYGMAEGFVVDHENEIAFLERFKRARKLDYDFAVTTDQTIQRAYGALSLPTAVIIDRKGVIRYIEAGTSPTRLDDMHEMIVRLLAEK
jgi:thiol-disulfide isomerase/thioredoxin